MVEIRINKTEFKKVIKVIKQIVYKNAMLPITESCRIQAASVLTITAGNQEYTLTYTFSTCSFSAPCVFYIGITDIIYAMRATGLDNYLTFHISADKSAILLIDKPYRISLQRGSKFPGLEIEISEPIIFNTTVAVLAETIKKSIWYDKTSIDIVSGNIHIELANTQLTFVTTDNKVISYVEISDRNINIHTNKTIHIQPACLKLLKHIFFAGKNTEPVQILIYDTTITFVIKNFSLTSNNRVGNYPKWRQYTNLKTDNMITFNRKLLSMYIKIVKDPHDKAKKYWEFKLADDDKNIKIFWDERSFLVPYLYYQKGIGYLYTIIDTVTINKIIDSYTGTEIVLFHRDNKSPIVFMDTSQSMRALTIVAPSVFNNGDLVHSTLQLFSIAMPEPKYFRY